MARNLEVLPNLTALITVTTVTQSQEEIILKALAFRNSTVTKSHVVITAISPDQAQVVAVTILGIVVVGLISYYYNRYYRYNHVPETFCLLMAVTFLVGTFLLLLSCLISISTASIISKTVFEVVYHSAAAVMYLAASLTLLVEVNNRKNSYSYAYEPYMAAGVIGLVISILYILSAVFASRSYRGL